MTKSEILKALKKSCNHQSVKLPIPLGMSIDENCLTIEISAERTCKNMQDDNSAFEGWACVIKRWIPEVEKVIIKWDEPSYPASSENSLLHYQRFLYRVKKFTEVYSWAEIHPVNRTSLDILKIGNGKKNIVNVPSRKRSRIYLEKKELCDYSENELENYILSDPEVKERFMKKFNLIIVDNQLPVGVFKEIKSEHTRIFPGRKSALDIWGISENNSCYLFELKTGINNKIGGISEMLFYSYVIQDIINGKMFFHSTRHEGLNDIIQAKKIKSFLLSPNRHPLIDEKVILLLNNSSSGIDYGNVKINNNFTFDILT